MADIKENFKKWLTAQGLSEKTPSGKPGTVYEYTRRINQLTDIIFKGHTVQHWELLARNIYSILGIHILCKNGKTFHSGKEIEEFLNTFLSEMSSYQNNLHDYFIIQIPIYKEDKVEYSTLPYELVKDLLPSLQNEVIILEISNSLSQISKNKNILIKFYKFLLDTQYCNTSCLGSNSQNNSSIVRKFYENLAIKLQEIESYLRNQIYALGVKIDGGNGRTPPLFVPLNSQETIVSSSWVCYLLRIERHTLSNLKTLKPTTSSSRWYSLSEVNDFIKNNFVPATETPADPIKIEPWWTVNEAIKNTGLNSKFIQRLRANNKISYVKVTRNIYIYYPYDFVKYTKINLEIAFGKN